MSCMQHIPSRQPGILLELRILHSFTGSNPVEPLIFFQASSFQLLKLENLLR